MQGGKHRKTNHTTNHTTNHHTMKTVEETIKGTQKEMSATSKNYQAGHLTLSSKELDRATSLGKEYVSHGRKIYYVKASRNAGYQIIAVYKERGPLPLEERGRFRFLDAGDASKLSGGLIIA